MIAKFLALSNASGGWWLEIGGGANKGVQRWQTFSGWVIAEPRTFPLPAGSASMMFLRRPARTQSIRRGRSSTLIWAATTGTKLQSNGGGNKYIRNLT